MREIASSLRQAAFDLLNPTKGLARRFSAVYHNNMWKDDESRSGPGSRRGSPCVVASIEALKMACDLHAIRSVADIPCGDFNWMGDFIRSRPGLAYSGHDIVPKLIEANRARNPGVAFGVLDVTSTVPPRVDLIFCKDMLNHLTYSDVRKALTNMKASGSIWLLASNNFGQVNIELPKNRGGMSRLLDICETPLSYGRPVWNTHYLGLWRLADM
jgi:hypothetical protein